MNEKERLEDLRDYKILDTAPEKDLDDLIEIASALFGAPISLITLIDDKRQWFKAAKGIADKETLRKDSFCQHTLNKPKEVLIIQDSHKDERFRNNVFVTGKPNIRFYAGAPLETPRGNVLGTFCIIDDKPREMSADQQRALQLLAKKAMDFLNARKLLLDQKIKIESDAVQLKKLTDRAPGCVYQFEMDESGNLFFHFVSKGIHDLHPLLIPEELTKDSRLLFQMMHVDDRDKILLAIQESYKNISELNVEFRVPSLDGRSVSWYWAQAKAEKKENGNVMWYGMFQDITNRKSYVDTLEQIAFDISHVLRRPIATMLGLTSIIQREELTKKQFLEYVEHIKTVSQEMDSFTRRLNQVYNAKRDNVHI